MVDAFDVANVLSLSFEATHTISMIRSGFHRSRKFSFDKSYPSVSTLVNVMDIEGKKVTVN